MNHHFSELQEVNFSRGRHACIVKRFLIFLTVFTLSLFSVSARAEMILLDDFNRSDSTDLGPLWTDQHWSTNRSVRIYANALTGDYDKGDLITYNGVTSNIVSVDVSIGAEGGTQAAGITMRYLDNGNNLYVKVQDNGGTSKFNRLFFYYFYHGIENDHIQGSVTPYYFDLPPFVSAGMTLSVSGNVANVELDTNFDGVTDMSYSYTGVPTDLGTGIGLINYGYARLDNFISNQGTPIPEPSTILLLGAGLMGVGLLRRRFKK
jgi:hypothetical protein